MFDGPQSWFLKTSKTWPESAKYPWRRGVRVIAWEVSLALRNQDNNTEIGDCLQSAMSTASFLAFSRGSTSNRMCKLQCDLVCDTVELLLSDHRLKIL